MKLIVARKVAQERVKLKQQPEDAHGALYEYKAANKLIGSDQITLTYGQVCSLQTELTKTRIAMTEAKARMERVAAAPDASALFAPDDELITKLRGERETFGHTKFARIPTCAVVIIWPDFCRRHARAHASCERDWDACAACGWKTPLAAFMTTGNA